MEAHTRDIHHTIIATGQDPYVRNFRRGTGIKR
jgi:hypothetical protein